jgi:hypothetical protein
MMARFTTLVAGKQVKSAARQLRERGWLSLEPTGEGGGYGFDRLGKGCKTVCFCKKYVIYISSIYEFL